MFRWLRKLAAPAPTTSTERPVAQLSRRRWEAARTDRLNASHWAYVTDRSLNREIADDLPTLRRRCYHEAANNPFVEGVIRTNSVDIVGKKGPGLQVISGSDAYNDALEAVWRDWAEVCDARGMQTLTGILKSWIRALWLDGEYLTQLITDSSAEGVTLRLLNLAPRRLGSPVADVSDDVFMGIEHSTEGRPTAYWITRAPDLDLGNSLRYSRIPADSMIHRFDLLEPGQLRGVPWLAPALSSIADMRDYDAQVLDAARAAADHSVVLESDHPDAKFLDVNECTEIERRMISTLPPGWKAKQLQAEQPMSNYNEYRAERMREIGRVRSMPLMMVMMDSSGHNYSSARFDGQLYDRANADVQGWLELDLNRLVDLVQTEAFLAREIPAAPSDVEYTWTWPSPPHVDPVKERQADRIAMQDGTLTYADACARQNKDWRQNIAQLARENEMLAEVDRPVWPQVTSMNVAPQEGDEPDDDGAVDGSGASTMPAEGEPRAARPLHNGAHH